jgi:hypothetical protein
VVVGAAELWKTLFFPEISGKNTSTGNPQPIHRNPQGKKNLIFFHKLVFHIWINPVEMVENQT